MLKDTYLPKIKATLTPSATRKLRGDIMGYVDRNGEILLTLDFSQRYSFGDDDRALIFSAMGTTLEEMEASVRESKAIYSGNKVQSNPFYLGSMLVVSHLLSKKDDDTANLVLTYMSLMMFTSLSKGFFKYGANKQAMDYTIANLDNTFQIRKFPSIFEFIRDNSATVLNTYRNRILRAADTDLTWVVDSTWTRLKGKLKKIANRFYENHESGLYLNAEEDSYAEDNYHEIDNVSFGIDRLTNKVYTKLVNRQYDRRFIRYAINSADTSQRKVELLIADIIDDDDEDGSMKTLISSMIEFFLQRSGKPIEYVAKGDFVAFMRTAFSSNTEIAQMETIKGVINKWLDDNMYKYGRASYGKTLKNQYRRTIYMFFIFVINYEAKV